MGFGDFGSNRSVHWRQFIGDGASQKPAGVGVDQKPHGDIGRGKAPKADHPGNFRVTARYPDSATARAALNEALKNVAADGTVLLDVPVRAERTTPFEPPEVTVDW